MRYTIEIDPALKRPIKIRTAQEEVSVRDWASAVLRKALAEPIKPAESEETKEPIAS